MNTRVLLIVLAVSVAILVSGSAAAGDMYWSAAPGLAGVNDFAVCGTTVYAATALGLLRSEGDPEDWQVLRWSPAREPVSSGRRAKA
jgi:hypothetical protein